MNCGRKMPLCKTRKMKNEALNENQSGCRYRWLTVPHLREIITVFSLVTKH